MKFIIFFILDIIALLYQSWVGLMLYNLYLFPKFNYELSFKHMVGVGLLMCIFTHQYIHHDEDETTEVMIKMEISSFVKPSFALIFGWLFTILFF